MPILASCMPRAANALVFKHALQRSCAREYACKASILSSGSTKPQDSTSTIPQRSVASAERGKVDVSVDQVGPHEFRSGQPAISACKLDIGGAAVVVVSPIDAQIEESKSSTSKARKCSTGILCFTVFVDCWLLCALFLVCIFMSLSVSPLSSRWVCCRCPVSPPLF